MFGFTHNERWLTSSLSHTHSRILHRSSMKLYLLSLSTGWQCMEVRLPCALCEMEQSLATSDHTVITPTPPFLAFTTTADFICSCRSRLITAPLRNRFFRVEQQTHVLFVYLAVFLYTKGFAWNVNFLFFAPQPCLALPACTLVPLWPSWKYSLIPQSLFSVQPRQAELLFYSDEWGPVLPGESDTDSPCESSKNVCGKSGTVASEVLHTCVCLRLRWICSVLESDFTAM